jgi:hypothetical protein
VCQVFDRCFAKNKPFIMLQRAIYLVFASMYIGQVVRAVLMSSWIWSSARAQKNNPNFLKPLQKDVSWNAVLELLFG